MELTVFSNRHERTLVQASVGTSDLSTYLRSLVGSHSLIWSPCQEICHHPCQLLCAVGMPPVEVGTLSLFDFAWAQMSSKTRVFQMLLRKDCIFQKISDSIAHKHPGAWRLSQTNANYKYWGIRLSWDFFLMLPGLREVFWQIFLCCFTSPKPLGAPI